MANQEQKEKDSNRNETNLPTELGQTTQSNVTYSYKRSIGE